MGGLRIVLCRCFEFVSFSEKLVCFLFLIQATSKRIRAFLKLHILLQESAFHPHESSESAHCNRIFLNHYPGLVKAPSALTRIRLKRYAVS